MRSLYYLKPSQFPKNNKNKHLHLKKSSITEMLSDNVLSCNALYTITAQLMMMQTTSLKDSCNSAVQVPPRCLCIIFFKTRTTANFFYSMNHFKSYWIDLTKYLVVELWTLLVQSQVSPVQNWALPCISQGKWS